ncbi:MAG: hypothetical protein VXY26_03105 [Bacteroidota bacterium]|nr:hypothetical protein [Bacteroidota bacterium]
MKHFFSIILFFQLAGCNFFYNNENFIEIINKKKIKNFDKEFKVLIAFDIECPISKQYCNKISSLSEKYSEDIDFLFFLPGPFYDEKETNEFFKKNKIKTKYIIDDDFSITNSLNAHVCPEAFIINSKSKVVYQGLIDNWVSELGRTRQYTNKNYLEDAIESILLNKKPNISKTKAIGCFIEKKFMNNKNSKTTPLAVNLIYEKCANCHYKNGPAPFSLTSYKDIVKRKKMISHVINSDYMPPWPADPNFSSFLGEKTLSEKEKKVIQNWLKQKNEAFDELEISFQDKKRTPDLIVRMNKEYKIDGDNSDKFLMMKFPFEIPKDTFIESINFVPGNKQIVHHVNAHLISYNEKKKNIFEGERIIDTEIFPDSICFKKLNLFNDDGSIPTLSRSVSNYLPGSVQASYPNGIGVLKASKKNVILVNDFHYGPSAKDTTDNSYFEIYFSKNPPTRNLREITLGTLGLKQDYYSFDTTFYCVQEIKPKLIIKPNQILSCSTRTKVLKDISILTINPHMHLLGKKIKSYAITPQKDTINLIKINDWNFRWQYFYTFEKMLKIPKNSDIIVEATFDNTKNNLDNPFDPPRKISEKIDWNGKGSMKTSDEMLQFIITYLPYKQNDENISLKP